MYIYTYIYIYIHIYVFLYMCVYIYEYIYLFIDVCIFEPAYISIKVLKLIREYVYHILYMCTYTFQNICEYIYRCCKTDILVSMIERVMIMHYITRSFISSSHAYIRLGLCVCTWNDIESRFCNPHVVIGLTKHHHHHRCCKTGHESRRDPKEKMNKKIFNLNLKFAYYYFRTLGEMFWIFLFELCKLFFFKYF
jgi:hypothetical protein